MTTHESIVVVTVDPVDVDVVSGRLWAAGVLGIEEREVDGGAVELRAGCAAGTDVEAVAGAVGGGRPVRVEPVTDDAWLDAWQAHAAAVEVGERLVVVPTWLPPGEVAVDAGRLRVGLPPHRAFGTGAHATTRLALVALERGVGPATSVLDVGCGSGLLAVAAARLGATTVVAVDVDPEAVRATRATAEENDVVVEVSATPVAGVVGSFDVVVANIVLPVLLDLMPAMADRVAEGGRLVLTGVLDDQVGRLADAVAACGLVVDRAGRPDGWSLDGWSLVEARRPASGDRRRAAAAFEARTEATRPGPIHR